MTSIRTRLVGLAATLTLIGILAGVPWLLLRIGPALLPTRLPTAAEIGAGLLRPDDGTLALAALVLAAWLAWLLLTVSVLTELVAAVRHVPAPRLPGLALPQWGARRLVAAAALLFLAAQLAGPSRPAAAVPVVATHAATSTSTPVRAAELVPPAFRRTAPPAPAAAAAAEADVPVHVVRVGESLWSIAERQLGAGSRYREIAALNADTLHGRPDFLLPGTRLRLPAGAATADHARAVTVHRGDTLSGIAARELGDADRYPELARATRPVTQPGGQHLTDPDVIDIGWTIRIPADAPTRRADRHHSDRPSHRRPVDRTTPGTSKTPRSTPPSRTPGAATPTAPPSTGPSSPTATADSTGEAVPTAAADHTNKQASGPGWLLAGLTGAGAVLAGSLLATLKGRRRSQWRSRQPGRTVAAVDPGLAAVEKTIMTVGARTAPTIEFVDGVLRRLGAHRAAAGRPMPALLAVELSGVGLTLHLAGADDFDLPWVGTPERLTWTVGIDADPDRIGPDVPDQPAPWPLLATVGSDDNQATWLLNYEHFAATVLTGDRDYVADFARHLAAELACHPWSRPPVRIDCLGVATETAPIDPERIQPHPGTRLAALLDDYAFFAGHTADRASGLDIDIATARAHQAGDDAWPARILLLHTDLEPPAALHQLLRQLADHPGRTGAAVVVDDQALLPSGHGLALELTADGRLTVPDLGLDLHPVGLTADEAAGCAMLLAQIDNPTPAPMPHHLDAEGWRRFADEAGRLDPDLTPQADTTTGPHRPAPVTAVPRRAHQDVADLDPVVAESLLPAPAAAYERVAAATAEDLALLAPHVPAATRRAVEAADPTLDADLDAWFAPDCRLPRLTLLGPVAVRAHGAPIAKRKPFYTELVAYLATRPHGATPEQAADAMGVTPDRIRIDITTIRGWLGNNPLTGRPHLPDARDSPAARARGIPIYQIDGLLVDADLFRRLRVRGQARGAAGIADLRRALDLVTGPPLTQLRGQGWIWMYDGDRLDLHLTAAVVDVAHAVTTHALHAGDLPTARHAVETALRAAPDDEVTRLDLAALLHAEGRPDQARRVITDDICNRSDDGLPPLELSDRTQAILDSHPEWLRRPAAKLTVARRSAR